MEIVGEYSDEGYSGKNIKGRQEFMRMLNDIEDGKDGVDFVLVFKLSRLGRNAADVLSSLQLMQDYGDVYKRQVGFICAGIFADDFQTKADAVFFSTKYGRTKAVKAKILAGIATTVMICLLYTSRCV